MRFFRRSLVTLGIAAALPTVVFVAVGAFYFLRAERERVESAALGRSEIVMMLVDARLRRDIAALNVVSNAVYLENQQWAEFYSRIERVRRANQAWKTIALLDARTRQEIFDLRRPYGTPGPLSAAHLAALRRMESDRMPLAGGVVREGEPFVWIYVPVILDDQLQYVLAAAITTQVFQELLVAFGAPATTSAIVDRDGNFIARSQSYNERVGTPATRFVREAIAGRKRGLYQGRTYEDVKNYTAFSTSHWSGWSAHLAVASTLIDTPTAWSFVTAGMAALGALLLGGFLITLVLRDMAERRHAEEALRQSQKMEAVGQLTGGIAHDFNNLLTAIIGNLDMIRSRVGDDERLRRLTDNALEAARRGAKVSSQLLAFSRSQRMSVGPVDLQQLFNGMSGLLNQSVGPAIAVRMHVDPDARMVMSDANQLELALLNLAVNARDAMPEGGQLTISVRRADAVDRQLPRGDYVDLCVVDTGMGMPENVRVRAIEPFFTTKPVGQGTGLGLSQVYAVARESGGTMRIDSEPSRGTTICLTLPMVLASAADPTPATSGDALTLPKEQSTPSASVLVVDDDRLVRRFMIESLRALGYEVFEANGGADALDLLEQRSFNLLLVDFAMPGMNGAELARAAQLKHPDTRVLIVSGYADSAAVEAALGSARQLRKPFNMGELGIAVAEALRR